MKTLIIIPSRYSSTRLPGKPLVDILGQSMIQRVYIQCKKAFKNVCIATDDERIIENVKEIGAEAIMTSKNHKSGTDRCLEAYSKFISKHPSTKIDLIINVQGDEPLINPNQILELENAFINDESIQIASMSKCIDNYEELFDHNIPKIITDTKSFAIYFSRECIPFIRDTNPSTWLDKFSFQKHIGIYAYRPEILHEICSLKQSTLELCEKLEQLRWIENSYKIKMVKTNYNSISIDTNEDLESCIKYLKAHIQ